MLYLIATPIGNLSDFSFRALKTIESCDYLLCEDTRRSRILLNHYQLQKPLLSYHKFNEQTRLEKVVQDLQQGKVIGLLSDAGTPCIADPGERLVAACRAEQINVIPIPGASSLIAALSASGFETERFQFVSFLPKKKGELTRALQDILTYPGTTICLESPFRLKPTFKVLMELAPERLLCVARELTKKFETFYYGVAATLFKQWEEKPPKGEVVLLIKGQN